MKVAECSIWQFYTKETQVMHVVFGISTRKKRKGSSEIGWIDFILCEERESVQGPKRHGRAFSFFKEETESVNSNYVGPMVIFIMPHIP